MSSVSRRTFLSGLAGLPLLAKSIAPRGAALAQAIVNNRVPVRPLTSGPSFHWFGYYDKWQFDPTDRYVLGNEVRFQGRSPGPDETIRIGMVDIENEDRWTELGETKAWCWQQGCMLQWLPGTQSEIIWNDREGKEFISHILDVKTGKKKTIGAPIYTVNPDSTWALHADFSRVHDTRPGYGYAGIPDPNYHVTAPKNSGLWRVNLKEGQQKMLFSFADIASINDGVSQLNGKKQWFNHLLYSPSGKKFCFLHRWQLPDHDFGTRLITANEDGINLYVLDPYGKTSHFYWQDDDHILGRGIPRMVTDSSSMKIELEMFDRLVRA